MLVLLAATAGLPGADAARAAPRGARVADAAVLQSPNPPAAATTSPASPTATATATPSPIATNTSAPTPPPCTATATLTPTATNTVTATGTAAITPGATSTMAPAATATSLATTTVTPTASATPTPTATVVPTTTTLPAAWSWTQLVPNGAAGSPPARQDAAVLVYGGTDIISSTTMSDLWAYRPATHAWTQLVSANSAPVGRFGAAGVWDTVGNRLLIFGGQQGIGTAATFFNDVEAYSPISNTWTTLSAPGAAGAPTPRSRVGAAWDSSAGCLLLFGGETADSPLTLSPQLWAFVPAEGGIAGQEADEQGRQTHQQEGDNQGGLATDAVAEMAGERAAKGACHKADEEGEQGQKRADERNRLGEKDFGEDECRHRAVEEEVVPFDGGPNGT